MLLIEKINEILASFTNKKGFLEINPFNRAVFDKISSRHKTILTAYPDKIVNAPDVFHMSTDDFVKLALGFATYDVIVIHTSAPIQKYHYENDFNQVSKILSPNGKIFLVDSNYNEVSNTLQP